MTPAEYRVLIADKMPERELAENVAEACTQLGLLRYHAWTSVHSPAGWPDEAIASPAGHGLLYRELKKQKGKVTGPQQAWLDTLAANGQDVDVWRPSDWLSGRIMAELRAIR